MKNEGYKVVINVNGTLPFDGIKIRARGVNIRDFMCPSGDLSVIEDVEHPRL